MLAVQFGHLSSQRGITHQVRNRFDSSFHGRGNHRLEERLVRCDVRFYVVSGSLLKDQELTNNSGRQRINLDTSLFERLYHGPNQADNRMLASRVHRRNGEPIEARIRRRADDTPTTIPLGIDGVFHHVENCQFYTCNPQHPPINSRRPIYAKRTSY